ncbi:MAG: cyclic nucleotide-binding domain-containing protein [Pirellulales bacterium]|nr:cyclic nucleotide-binding domain-containing protein [Pirellulales bacterium]
MNTGGPTRETLLKIPVLAGLNETERRQLAHAARLLEFLPGQEIMAEGADTRELWILLSGRCQVLKRRRAGITLPRPVVLATLEPYQHFGEMSFFHAAPHSAAIVAETAVQLLCLDRSEFDELISDGACAPYKLAFNAMSTLADRLRRMDDWITELIDRDGTPKQVAEWEELRRRMFASGLRTGE